MFAPELAPKIRFAMREMKLFAAHSFDPEDAKLVERLTGWLEKIGFSVVTGETGEAAGISTKVRRRIDDGEVFAGIFTRSQSKGDGSYTTKEWLLEEKTYAFTNGKPLMLFVEEGVDIGGMHADYEYIPFRRDDLASPMEKSFEYALELSGLRIHFNVSAPNKVDLKFEGEYLNPETQLTRIDQLLKRSPKQYNLKLRRCDLLTELGRRQEAKSGFSAVLEDNPRAYEALHKLAQLHEQDGEYEDANPLYERALILEPTKCRSYCQYGRCLVTQGRQQQIGSAIRHEVLTEAKKQLSTAIEFAQNTNCKGIGRAQQHLRLAETASPPRRSNSNSKRKKSSR